MLNKKDNLIIFVLCLIVISLGVLIALKNPAGVKIAKNTNTNLNQNISINQNTNINQNINTNQQINNNGNNKKQTPEKFVKEFYDYCFGPHHPAGINGFEFVKNSNYLSDSFLKRIEGDKFRSYLLTCAQERPISREYEKMIMMGSAKILAHHFYSQKDNQIIIILNLKNDKWEIEDIQCPNNNQKIIDQIDTSNWITYNDEIAGFNFKYPSDILWGDMSTNIVSSRLVLNVSTSLIDSFPLNAPSGYNKETILEDKKALEKGKFSNIRIDWPSESSNEILKFNSGYGRSFAVFMRFEICDVTFERKLFFYHNNYMITITLYGPIEEIIFSMPKFFKNIDGCGVNKIWNLEANNENQFYKTLKNHNASVSAQNWYDIFDEIVKTVKIK